MKSLLLATLLTCCCQSARAATPPQPETAAETSLAGTWRFALDPGDRGISGRWFERKLAQSIKLPGTLQAQGFGNPIG